MSPSRVLALIVPKPLVDGPHGSGERSIPFLDSLDLNSPLILSEKANNLYVLNISVLMGNVYLGNLMNSNPNPRACRPPTYRLSLSMNNPC